VTRKQATKDAKSAANADAKGKGKQQQDATVQGKAENRDFGTTG
jgi:hypothetical protein